MVTSQKQLGLSLIKKTFSKIKRNNLNTSKNRKLSLNIKNWPRFNLKSFLFLNVENTQYFYMKYRHLNE